MRAILLGTLGALLFTMQDAAVKWLSSGYSIPQIVFLRSVLAFVIAAIWLRYTPNALRIIRPRLFFPAIAASILAWWAFYTGLARLPLTTAISIFFLVPMVIALFAIPILKEKPTIVQVIALVAGFGGVIIITNPFAQVQPLDLLAVCFILLSVFLWAFVATVVRALTNAVAVATILFYSTVGFLLVFGGMQPWVWETPPLSDFVFMLLLGVLSTAAQVCMWTAYRSGRAALVAISEYSAIIFAALLGWWIWNEQLSQRDIWGILLIVGAGLVAVFYKRKRKPAAPLVELR